MFFEYDAQNHLPRLLTASLPSFGHYVQYDDSIKPNSSGGLSVFLRPGSHAVYGVDSNYFLTNSCAPRVFWDRSFPVSFANRRAIRGRLREELSTPVAYTMAVLFVEPILITIKAFKR